MSFQCLFSQNSTPQAGWNKIFIQNRNHKRTNRNGPPGSITITRDKPVISSRIDFVIPQRQRPVAHPPSNVYISRSIRMQMHSFTNKNVNKSQVTDRPKKTNEKKPESICATPTQSKQMLSNWRCWKSHNVAPFSWVRLVWFVKRQSNRKNTVEIHQQIAI